MPADGPGHYFMARLRGGDVAAVGSLADQAPPTPAWNTYVAVENAHDTAAKVTADGGIVLAGPLEVFESGRMAVCADPAGGVPPVAAGHPPRGRVRQRAQHVEPKHAGGPDIAGPGRCSGGRPTW